MKPNTTNVEDHIDSFNQLVVNLTSLAWRALSCLKREKCYICLIHYQPLISHCLALVSYFIVTRVTVGVPRGPLESWFVVPTPSTREHLLHCLGLCSLQSNQNLLSKVHDENSEQSAWLGQDVRGFLTQDSIKLKIKATKNLHFQGKEIVGRRTPDIQLLLGRPLSRHSYPGWCLRYQVLTEGIGYHHIHQDVPPIPGSHLETLLDSLGVIEGGGGGLSANLNKVGNPRGVGL